MLKNLLAQPSATLPYLAMAQTLSQALTKGSLSRRPIIQRVAIGGLVGAGMAFAAIVIGQRLKTRATDMP